MAFARTIGRGQDCDNFTLALINQTECNLISEMLNNGVHSAVMRADHSGGSASLGPSCLFTWSWSLRMGYIFVGCRASAYYREEEGRFQIYE